MEEPLDPRMVGAIVLMKIAQNKGMITDEETALLANVILKAHGQLSNTTLCDQKEVLDYIDFVVDANRQTVYVKK